MKTSKLQAGQFVRITETGLPVTGRIVPLWYQNDHDPKDVWRVLFTDGEGEWAFYERNLEVLPI